MIVKLQDLIDTLQAKADEVDDPSRTEVGLIGYDKGSEFAGIKGTEYGVLYDSGQKTEIIWLILESFKIGE